MHAITSTSEMGNHDTKTLIKQRNCLERKHIKPGILVMDYNTTFKGLFSRLVSWCTKTVTRPLEELY